MRTVVFSITARDQLRALLIQGVASFGAQVVAQKRDLVFATIEQFLVAHPEAKQPHSTLALRCYPVSRTPFVVLYDFDAAELRVHFGLHKSASLEDLDPKSVQW